jgi:hypothetical protein
MPETYWYRMLMGSDSWCSGLRRELLKKILANIPNIKDIRTRSAVYWSTPVNGEIYGRDLRGRLPGFKIHYSCGCDASDEEEKGNHSARKDDGT